jgi:cytochrome b involved in lipid metabolism
LSEASSSFSLDIYSTSSPVYLSPPFSTPETSHITMSKSFSKSDVATHNKPDNLYIIVDNDVYDLTNFQEEHPGKIPDILDTTT